MEAMLVRAKDGRGGMTLGAFFEKEGDADGVYIMMLGVGRDGTGRV
jgi:hypothetical protein